MGTYALEHVCLILKFSLRRQLHVDLKSGPARFRRDVSNRFFVFRDVHAELNDR